MDMRLIAAECYITALIFPLSAWPLAILLIRLWLTLPALVTIFGTNLLQKKQVARFAYNSASIMTTYWQLSCHVLSPINK